MADETTTDKPLSHIAEVEHQMPQPEPADEPMSGAARLRAFEDKHFGEKAVRIQGRIERGSGSPYQMAHPSVREHYGKLEKLIAAEQKLAEAHTALIAADAEHDAAEKAVDDSEMGVADGPADQ